MCVCSYMYTSEMLPQHRCMYLCVQKCPSWYSEVPLIWYPWDHTCWIIPLAPELNPPPSTLMAIRPFKGLIARHIYRVSQEECARLREGVPYVKVYRYNPKHLCLKFNGYGDNGQRKVWSCGSTHCTFQLTILSISVLECGVI